MPKCQKLAYSAAVQVLLPVAADVAVSDEVFKRSGRELKHDWQRAKKEREQSEMLMTRAMRERLAAKKKRQHAFARVRVRFPEGVILQGAHGGLCCAGLQLDTQELSALCTC